MRSGTSCEVSLGGQGWACRCTSKAVGAVSRLVASPPVSLGRPPRSCGPICARPTARTPRCRLRSTNRGRATDTCPEPSKPCQNQWTVGSNWYHLVKISLATQLVKSSVNLEHLKQTTRVHAQEQAGIPANVVGPRVQNSESADWNNAKLKHL